MGNTMQMFRDWTLFEKVWLVLFTAVNIYLFFAFEDSLLGLISSLTGMMCVVLVAKGKISNYYFGIVQTASYAYISYGYSMLFFTYPFSLSVYTCGRKTEQRTVFKEKM